MLEAFSEKEKQPVQINFSFSDTVFKSRLNQGNVHIISLMSDMYFQVYRDLTLLEERYEDIATDDVMSMAAKSRKILQAVR